MAQQDDAKSLSEVVDEITSAGERKEQISVEEIMNAVGRRSFGPLLLVPGLIVLSPLSGVPGVPTLGGIVIFLFSVQMLLGREYFWLPAFILRRQVSRDRMAKAGRFLAWLARWADKVIKPRLLFLLHKPASHVVAVACTLIAVIMPPLELIPFANVVTASAISAFGLALVAYDGVLAVLAFLLTGVSFYLLVSGLLLS
ncbi:hypothetical protein CAI21_17105 [Alkalilimnicola ehrlichii]|uniref:Exopolysaccharide biosynthesis protein n=1 Tax=Alkalilimnicola ehrlichii TaxID=351052 RepID=A0A3E0WKH3_9GAMM|nr:exopolysaccharide biosynthesis protein [Alkalilimnicola ehrlichii]RFA26402.1 hypothetical protein CAI21_17105 [Alkalilimnicola ehrlichii]RFA33464.1 hypothetical protein CAL65_17580 [Alkalilimnicola ehrlichii]